MFGSFYFYYYFIEEDLIIANSYKRNGICLEKNINLTQVQK